MPNSIEEQLAKVSARKNAAIEKQQYETALKLAKKEKELRAQLPDEIQMDIHTYFNLTYANYLIIPRTLLRSMPEEWQVKFVKMLGELNSAFEHIERADVYRVTAVDPTTGRFVKEPVPHYNRGRTHIEPMIKK